MDTWPINLFAPRSVRWRLQGVSNSGGTSVSGLNRFARTDGGGFWVCQMSGIWLRRRDHLLAMRALEGLLAGGVATILVPSCECRLKPLPVEVTTCGGTVPHSDGSPFSDGTEYVSGAIEITAAAAALRATSLTISIVTGSGLRGGEHFSIDHTTKGRRMYRVIRVGEAGVVTIDPPLREAITADTILDFDNPSLPMRILNPDDFFGAIELGRFAEAAPLFQESFDV